MAKTSDSVRDVAQKLSDDSIDPRFKQKVERMLDEFSDEDIAQWLFDRSALPDELRHKYGFDRVMSNVSAGEIPEEAPDFQGETGSDDGNVQASVEVPDTVDDYNELTIAQLNKVIEMRNADREPDDQIVPDGTRKADLVSALEDDDEA